MKGNDIYLVYPCHHSMAGSQVVDGGLASNMEDSCEYIKKKKKSRCGQPTRGGPPSWGLGEVLTIAQHKKYPVTNRLQGKPHTWTDINVDHCNQIKK